MKATTVTKPKACKQNLAQWALMMDGMDDGHGIVVSAPARNELALAVPPRPNHGEGVSPFQGSIVR